ncbi:MAG TPA: ATP-dependent DNA helicase Rep [Chromatiaceae bacterium]|nr:ATP-dependent DNA helicase Rep [Chromatiaceae bacterium]
MPSSSLPSSRLSQLNPEQRAAVRYVDGPLLVLAGAGSGKTRVITEKIAHLITHHQMKARHIVAVTFTNKAAREMKSRVAKLLDGQPSRGLTVSTFHRLGMTILRRECDALGLTSSFSLYDTRDSSALLLELLKRDAGTDREYIEQIRGQISKWKNALIEPQHAISIAADKFEVSAAVAFAAYERQLRSYNAVDLDDLIGLPVQVFEQNPERLDHWQNRVRHLLVDEYQDTNQTQYKLVHQLTRIRHALTAVGDDDQSIYSWRGAQPENLAQLSKDFPQLKVIKLEQNYRSTNVILHAANTLIANNPHTFEKRLWSASGMGDAIRVLECKNEQQEAERVIGDLVHHRFSSGGRYADYAILFRGNFQARLFEKILREQGVPYVLSGGQSFFDYTEIKDLLAYLKLLLNPDDSGSFLRIANTPRRGIGASTLEKLARFSGERECSLLDACFSAELGQHLGKRALKSVQGFAQWVMDTAARAASDDAPAILRQLIIDIDYEDWIRDQHDEPVADKRVANVADLCQWIEKMGARDDGVLNLQDMISRLTLMDILDRADTDDIGDRVALMTLHAAKGLEFPRVYIAGMEEELLPHRTSIEEDGIEEERRVAYVGITRAQKGLTLSMARQRRRHGDISACEPSRFLGELPEENLQWIGGKQTRNAEEQKEYAAAHLSNLRSLLAT